MFVHRKISAAARGVASFGEDVFPHREHNAEMASRSAITDGRLSLFSFLMSNLMGIRYIDNIDRQLITANNLLKKFHDLMSLGYQGNRSADIKSMHLAAERCAFELFQSGYPTVTMLQLLVAEGQCDELYSSITTITDTWNHLATCGTHHIIEEIRKYQEKVVFEAGPWARCLLADGYGGRYCVFGQNAVSFLNATLKAEWSNWTHRRTTTEHTLTKNTVVIPPIAFNELCTKERGNDWLPTIGQLRVLVASSPVAPQHKWMLRNSSFENILNRQMSPNASSEQVYICDSDTEVEVTCQLALFRSKRAVEQVELIFQECEAESSSSDGSQTPAPEAAVADVVVEPARPQRSLGLASVNGGGAP